MLWSAFGNDSMKSKNHSQYVTRLSKSRGFNLWTTWTRYGWRFNSVVARCAVPYNNPSSFATRRRDLDDRLGFTVNFSPTTATVCEVKTVFIQSCGRLYTVPCSLNFATRRSIDFLSGAVFPGNSTLKRSCTVFKDQDWKYSRMIKILSLFVNTICAQFATTH